jgi:lysine-ketoglutarate reductase/saccharopine dehydrogenase-like protein (TIGR00300 family)
LSGAAARGNVVVSQSKENVVGFELPEYVDPEFASGPLASCPDARLEQVVKPGVAPAGYHATTIYPEYIKVEGRWLLANESRMDCVIVVRDGGALEVKEFRRLEPGERVVVGRSEDGSEGILVHAKGFSYDGGPNEPFVFRTGRTRETAYSMDYDRLYDLLEFERENGYVVWVLGPAVAFDSDSRQAMSGLIENGFVDAVLAGNALATHDLEASLFKTGLGQNIYTQASEPGGHYNHLDTLNMARDEGSTRDLIRREGIENGIVAACVQSGVPLVTAGSIRDDGPMPETIADVYAAQDAMRAHARKATTLIALATQLHAIAAGNMTPSYQVVDGQVRPVYIYVVDVSEFAVNKLRDRGTLEVTSIVTNVQDFLVLLGRRLL